MKYLDEFQDPELARRLLDEIHATVTRPWALMEVCGGQTHSIIRHGIDQLLPEQVELIHGPGCPVCVTPLEMIDKALEIASRPDVIFCSFGDMLRVPGTGRDLFRVRSEGGDVRVVYSPLDALRIAQENPERAGGLLRHRLRDHRAAQRHDGVPGRQAGHPQLQPAGLARPRAAGHRGDHAVAELPGAGASWPRARVQRDGDRRSTRRWPSEFEVPIVVTGFEPLDILEGVRRTVRQLERGEHFVENAYARAVRPEGNPAARAMLADVFEVTDRAWRGIGVIPDSGWRLSPRYREYDAEHALLGRAASPRSSRRNAAAARYSRA